MSDNQQYILSLCVQLSRQGKKPSVALIKQLSTRALLLPQIISTLKRYKDDPSFTLDTVEVTEPVEKPLSLEQKVEELTQRVALLEAQLQSVLDNK